MADIDFEELYLDDVPMYREMAHELIQDSIELARTTSQDSLEYMRELTTEIDDLEIVEQLGEQWVRGRYERINQGIETARALYEFTHESVEQYIEAVREDAMFKLQYLRKYGVDGFDIDPEGEPLWDQISMDDILRDFFENQVDQD